MVKGVTNGTFTTKTIIRSGTNEDIITDCLPLAMRRQAFRRRIMQFDIQKCKNMKCVKIYGEYFGEKTFPSLNNLLTAYGSTPYKGNAMKQKFQKICMDEVRFQLRRWKAEKPVILHYYFFEPNKGHKRDRINIFSMADKCFSDALVKCEVIVDDNPTYLLNATHDFFTTDDIPGFEVYIEEVEE